MVATNITEKNRHRLVLFNSRYLYTFLKNHDEHKLKYNYIEFFNLNKSQTAEVDFMIL